MPDTLCPACGNRIETDRIGGLCPVCLVQRTLGAAEEASPEPALRTFAGYELREELGRGGMGVVYRAWQPALQRNVAIKLLLGGAFAGAEAAQRFLREAKLAAGLRHPNVVAIHEVGEAEGQAFYAMELIEGRSLAALTRERLLPARRVATYLEAVARAVASAHAQGVLHRDLKPSNVLIDAFDQPRVADFGLARLIDDPELTRTTDALGSPPYMAPEQLPGRTTAPGPAADVYGLGALLYHALTGRAPFQGESAAQILAQVERDPPVAPRQLNPAVPADLETIALKCLEKDPRRRYAGAADFADDLARFIAGKPVHARPLGAAARTWRMMRRHPVVASLLAVIVLASVALAGLGVHALRLSRSDRAKTYAADMLAASLAIERGDFATARARLAENADDETSRGFEWRWLAQQAAERSLARWPAHPWIAAGVAFCPDGTSLATTGEDGRVRLWKPSGQLLREWAAASGLAWQPAFTPDGAQLLTSGPAGGVILWEVASGRRIAELPGQQATLSPDGRRLATVDASLFFWKEPGTRVRISDLTTLNVVAEIGVPVRGVAFSPDGRRIALVGGTGELRLCDATNGAEVAVTAPIGAWTTPAFSPDGSLVASGSARGAICWRPADSTVQTLSQPERAWAVAFSANGKRLLTCSTDRRVRFFDATTGALLGTRGGLTNEIWSLARSPDGGTFAAGLKDGTVAILPNEPETAVRTLPHVSWSRPVFSSDSARLATILGNESLVWETAHWEQQPATRGRVQGFGSGHASRLELHGLPARLEVHDSTTDRLTESWPMPDTDDPAAPAAGVSPAGEFWWSLEHGGVARVRATVDGREVGRVVLPLENADGVLSDDGRTLLLKRLAGRDDTRDVWLVDVLARSAMPLAGHRDEVTGLALSRDRRRAAYGSVDGNWYLWDLAPLRLHRVFPSQLNEVSDVAFSPDGRLVAALEIHRGVQLWQLSTGRMVLSHDDPIAGARLAFSPDGKVLAYSLDSGDPQVGVRLIEAP